LFPTDSIFLNTIKSPIALGLQKPMSKRIKEIMDKEMKDRKDKLVS